MWKWVISLLTVQDIKVVNITVNTQQVVFLYDFFGENIFRSDICNADVKLGDLLIHEGAACDAQKYAAQVFNADKTYSLLMVLHLQTSSIKRSAFSR